MKKDNLDTDLNGKKILITSCAGLGDLLMFTPALRKIKEAFAYCKITFVTNLPNKDVLSGLPYIDKVATIQRKKAFGRFHVLPELATQDYVIFTDWQPHLLVAAYLFRVPHRIGIPKPNHRLNGLFTKVLKTNVVLSPRYAAETNARLFSEALNISLEGDMTDYDISLPQDEDVQNATRLLTSIGVKPGDKYICFAPFTGMEQRNWPIEHVKEYVRLVKKHLGLSVVVIGPPGKADVARNISLANLVGKTSVLEMVDIVRRAALFVGLDSGPMHIAGAVNTPLIALFNKDLPSRWAPKKQCRVIKLDLPCSPCDDETARNCKTLQCTRGITPQRVWQVTLEECQRLGLESVSIDG